MLLYFYVSLDLFSLNCHGYFVALVVLFCPSIFQHWWVYSLWLWSIGPLGIWVPWRDQARSSLLPPESLNGLYLAQ